MTGLQLVFRVATRDLYAGWLSMVTRIQNAWTDMSSGVSQGAVSFVANLINVMAGIPTGIQNAFATVFTWLDGTWDKMLTFRKKTLLYLYSLFDQSVNYEQAAKQMDTEAQKRAADRQKGLDSATEKRNEDLQRANQGRLGIANEMNRGIQADANATKQGRENANAELLTGFDAQIEKLRKELEIQTTAIRDTADEQAKAEAKPSELAQKTPPPEKPKIPTVQQVKATTATQTAGTFSGFAAGMMGGTTSALDRMADQTAKSNEFLNQIAQNTSGDKQPTYGS